MRTERRAQQHAQWTEAWRNSRVHPVTREGCGLNHSLACLFCSLSFLLLLSSSLDWFPCSDIRTLFGSSLSLRSSHGHLHGSCVLWALLLISSTSPFTSSLWSPCCSCYPTLSTSMMSWKKYLRTSAEDLGTLAENDPPTGYEPNDHFITEAYVAYTQESLGEQQFPDDFDYDDVTIGQTLLDACRRRADHSEEEGLSSCLSTSVSHCRTVKLVLCRLVTSAQETQRHNSESEQIRTLLERQREQILVDFQAEIRKHEFQADYDRRSIQKLTETIESQKEEICRGHQGDEQHRRHQQLLHEQLLKQNWDLREAHEKSLSEMEELKRFQGSTFDSLSRRKLVEDRDTIHELTGRIRELQNEINCMSDSRDFKDAESVRSGHSHVASQPVSFPPHPVPGGMLSRSVGMPSRKDGPPSIWDTHGISGNDFANPTASSSARYPQELNPWSSHISEQIHSSQAGKSENQTLFQDPRFQSGPSAKKTVIPSEGDSSKNYGADQQRLHISDLHFEKFITPATFSCWKIRFKTEVCICSQFPTEAMLWIKKSGNGWFSGWSKIFVLRKRNSNAIFWSTRCEDCFSTEQNHP